MYLNYARLATSKIVNTFVITACALPTVVNILFLIFAFSNRMKLSGVGLYVYILFFSLLIAGGIALIIWRITAIRKVSRCRIYNSLIEEDHDGIITYDSIASMTGMSVAAVIKDLMWFTKHGFIVNVTLGRTAVRVDVVPGANEFIKVSCPSCGATVNIRKGGGGRCEHCGTFMRAKEDQNV